MSQETKSRKAKKQQNKKKKKFSWKKLFISLLIVGLLGTVVVVAVAISFISDAPSLDAEQLEDPLSTTIVDRNGEFVAELGAEKRRKITYEDLSPLMEDAVLATEDVRFWDHSGIDFRRTAAAVLANITDGFGSQGGSTITQQVVKNAFLTKDKKIKRKVQEQYLAIQLEKEYSKQQILMMYLNKIYYGNGLYGVAKASEAYFGKKDLGELTIAEAALLAGIPQRPSAYDPVKNPDLAEERRNTVLNLMVHHGKITEAQAEEAKQVKVADMIQDDYETEIPYDSFIEQVVRETEDELGDDVDIFASGLTIHTTLDRSAQEQVEYLLSDESPVTFPDDEMEAGIAAIDTKTGEILAIGGGRNKKDGIGAGFNFALNSKRQPGSAIKPILDFGPAIEHLKWSTYHQMNDEPISFPGKDEPISNAGRGYHGWMTMREALYQSYNTTAYKAFDEVGAGKAAEFAEGLGMELPDSLVPSDSIGGGDLHTNPLEMAGAFAAFGNEGIYNEPHSVKKVVMSDGEEIEINPESRAAMSDYTAYMITDMLKDVPRIGTGARYTNVNIPVAAKTGTTNKDRDSWLVGYSTNFTISVWGGYDDESPIPDKSIPQRLFSQLMNHMSEGVETADFVRPSSVVEVAVEKGSRPAKLASDYTPSDQIVTELFVKGHEPTETSDTYVEMDPVSNFQAVYEEEDQLVNLFWEHPLLGDSDRDIDVEFELSVSVDGSDMQSVTTTSETEFTFDEIEPGSTYSFELVAIDANNSENQSDPVTTSVEIPAEEEEEPEEEEEESEEDSEEDNEEENEGNDGNGNNGNGNNGNGNNDDNNTGNNNDGGDNSANDSGGQGQGNDEGQGDEEEQSGTGGDGSTGSDSGDDSDNEEESDDTSDSSSSTNKPSENQDNAA
ncbi:MULTISPECIES: transglycosylase domain-containing protein [Allobacillus]|uniref:PBP1A family penicillin-binding protein n=1 Tax=Allobacillus salarius TaxID=1955272 RepID=A0A556PT16_9BACI|nr:PBP1A family penicillin-binding protein [Allobacillus salarius]TSJ67535.1 PBP1A family penicillin-binding protein [Allobacillus salarius]